MAVCFAVLLTLRKSTNSGLISDTRRKDETMKCRAAGINIKISDSDKIIVERQNLPISVAICAVCFICRRADYTGLYPDGEKHEDSTGVWRHAGISGALTNDGP